MKKHIRQWSLLCSGIVFTAMIHLHALGTSITVNGPIAVNTTWNADTIKVTGDVTVQNGVTLTIVPGTRVEFQGHFRLNCDGRIVAIGTQADMIQFTINDTTGFSNMTSNNGGWFGVRYNNTAATHDTSKFSWC